MSFHSAPPPPSLPPPFLSESPSLPRHSSDTPFFFSVPRDCNWTLGNGEQSAGQKVEILKDVLRFFTTIHSGLTTNLLGERLDWQVVTLATRCVEGHIAGNEDLSHFAIVTSQVIL